MPALDRSSRSWNRFATASLASLALVGAGALLASGRLFAQTPPAQAVTGDRIEAKAAIAQVLSDQTTAWNRGDLDAFLKGYWDSPWVVFQSGGNRYDGFSSMRNRYRKRYQADGKAMGKLAFPDVEIEILAADAAFVRGGYALDMPDGAHPTGLFTLIFRRIDGAWKIVHDHTSTAEAPTPRPDPNLPPQPPPPAPPG